MPKGKVRGGKGTVPTGDFRNDTDGFSEEGSGNPSVCGESCEMVDTDDSRHCNEIQYYLELLQEKVSKTQSHKRTEILRKLLCFLSSYKSHSLDLSDSPDLANLYLTLTSVLRRNFGPSEVCASLKCLACAALHFDNDDVIRVDEWLQTDDFALQLQTLIRSSDYDSIRSSASQCLAVLLLTSPSADQLTMLQLQSMEVMEGQFRKSFLKGDGLPPDVKKTTSSMHQQTLMDWGLLFTIVSESVARKCAFKSFPGIATLLHSKDNEMILAAGIVLAVMCERIRSLGYERFPMKSNADAARDGLDPIPGEKIVRLRERLVELSSSTNSSLRKMFSAKQRGFLRAVNQYVCDQAIRPQEQYYPLSETVNLSLTKEVLVLDNWRARYLYDYLSGVVSSGLDGFLQNVQTMRDQFDLGPVSLPDKLSSDYKDDRNERIRTKKMQRLEMSQREKTRYTGRHKNVLQRGMPNDDDDH